MKTRTAFVLTAILLGCRLASAQVGYILTYAGNDHGSFPGNGGPATSAIISNPAGLALDPLGNLYIAASGNSLIRQVNANTGIITTVAGGGTGGDGGLATAALLSGPCDVKVDSFHNIFISETCVTAQGGTGGGGSGTGGIARIRRVDGTTGIISTIAGTTSSGFAGDGGPATSALLNTPMGMALDAAGNLFIADAGNNRIRRIDAATGFISTVAGNGVAAYAGDGGLATAASLNGPAGLTVDSNGNLFIADMMNNAIRRVDAVTGVITTVAGTGTGGFNGDGIAATSANLLQPGSVILSSGNLVFADFGNNRVRMIDNAGLIWTIAGDGSPTGNGGQIGDNGPASIAELSHPLGVVALPSGPLFISELTGDRVREVNVTSTGINTAVMVSSSANSPGAGQQVTLTATLTASNGQPSSAGGGVYFFDGITSPVIIGSAAIVNGAASITFSTQVSGVHNISAGYTGSSNFGGSVSPYFPLTVGLPSTTVSLTANPNPVAANQAVTLTATVSPSSATGPVSFYNGPAPLGSGNLSGGVATLSVPGFAAGVYSLTAQYSGDSTHSAATSSAVSLTVKANAAIMLTSSPNPAIEAQSVTFTASITPATATGTVQFLEGGVQFGSAPVVSGAASFARPFLTDGQHTITASYSGDALDSSATSTLTQTINPRTATTATVAAYPNPSPAASPVTFTATVSPSAATGTVQFLDGATVLGTATLANGSATFTTSSLAAGAHSITVSYSGDATNASSTSSAVTETILVSTTVTLTSSQNPAPVGTPVILTATVSPATATGTVQFFDGATVLGSGTLANGSASFTTSTLNVGTHSVKASYGGDASDSTSTSSVITETILATTTVTLTSNQNPAPVGTPVILTAAVSPATATGTVQFIDGATVLGSGTLANGSASFTTSTLTAGTHSVKATYGGDASNATSTSAVIVQTIQAPTTVTLTSNQNPIQVGAPVILTAAVSPSTATGTVQFLDGATVLGTATLASGSASFTTTTLAQGTHSITAVYGGDANDSGSTSVPFSESVKAITGLSLVSSLNPSTLGQTVTFTVNIDPAATGTVQFLDGASVLSTVTVSSGVAAYSTSSLTQGTHGISVIYSGDANYMSSQSAAMTQTVNAKASTVTTVTSAQNPAFAGAPVTFTASVSPAAATGTVQFLDGAAVLGTATLASGSASFTTSALTQGAHSITAVYSGDTGDTGSTSAVLTQTINSKATTSTTLTSTPNPAFASTAVTFTATVSPSTATGTVQFLDGGAALGTASLSNGAASFTFSSLAQGTHSITANYSGDASDAASGSAPLSQVMKLSAGMTTGLTPSPAVQGQTVHITANMNSAATGTVQFTDGATLLATVPVSAGTASFSTTSLALGSHTLGVAYSGDATYMSASTTFPETVIAASTVVVASSANPSAAGQSVTFTATVTPSTATGAVQFFDGGTLIGTASLASGSAAIATASLARGSHSISATYAGDASDAGAASATLNQIVKAVSSVSLTSSLNPSPAGQSVTFTASVTPSAATGAIQFLDGSTVLATVNLTSGSASYSTATLAAGAHSITASYSGDALDTAATSPVLTQTVNVAAPSAPSNLTASASGSSQINLAWHASATGGVTYNVYGSTTNGFTPSAANRLGTGVASLGYSATPLIPGTIYYFRVTAVNAGGESAATNQANATTANGFACHVTYSVTDQWNNGFTSALTIQNTGTTKINSWTLTWTWPGNQAVTQSWNATYQQSGANMTLNAESFNKQIAAGATLTGVGFNGSYSGTNPAPTTFSVNGTVCH